MVRPKKNKLPAAPSKEEINSLDISINSVEQIKEACSRVGLSIDKYLTAIDDALSACKTTIDKDNEEHVEPDHDKRLKAALLGLELEGYIRNKAAGPTDNSKHTHVTYSWQPVQVINTMSRLNVQ